MFNTDTELLFPSRVIPSLRNLRGEEWQELIDQLSAENVDEIDLIAFTAMIAKLGGAVVVTQIRFGRCVDVPNAHGLQSAETNLLTEN